MLARLPSHSQQRLKHRDSYTKAQTKDQTERAQEANKILAQGSINEAKTQLKLSKKMRKFYKR